MMKHTSSLQPIKFFKGTQVIFMCIFPEDLECYPLWRSLCLRLPKYVRCLLVLELVIIFHRSSPKIVGLSSSESDNNKHWLVPMLQNFQIVF